MRLALETLRRGGLILYPTDTVWGLGCDACNAAAVARLREVKGRAVGKALLVLVGSEGMLERYVERIPDIAYELIDAADTPMTIIYDHSHGLAPGVADSDGSVGVRISGEPFSRELSRRLGRPLVSTSANLAGEITPANYRQISDSLKEAVDYVVEYGRDEDEEHLPSHIIKVSDSGVIKIIR